MPKRDASKRDVVLRFFNDAITNARINDQGYIELRAYNREMNLYFFHVLLPPWEEYVVNSFEGWDADDT